MRKHSIDITFLLWVTTIILMATLMGCSTSRNMNKSSRESSVVDKSQIEENTGSKLKQTTETNEQVDTTVKTKPDSSIGSKPLNNIVTGEPLVVETDGSKVTVNYDPITGNLKASLQTKGQDIDVKINKSTKTTTEQADTSSKKTQNNIAKKQKDTAKVVVSKGPGWMIYAGLSVFILIALCLGAYKLYRFVKRTRLL